MAGPYAIRGSVYVGSITGATGSSGTLLKGIDEGEVEIVGDLVTIEKRSPNRRLDVIGTGLADARVSVILRLRGHDSDSVGRIWGWLASSGAVSGGVHKIGSAATATALIVRPANTSEKYFYSPATTLVRADGLSLFYSQRRPVHDEVEVEFACGIAVAAPTEPAFLWDTSSALNTAYAALT